MAVAFGYLLIIAVAGAVGYFTARYINRRRRRYDN
jgi:hypothetical protein